MSSSCAACKPRARARTERLAQSRPRSSSSSAPRMRVEAKRSNAMPRSGSKLARRLREAEHAGRDEVAAAHVVGHAVCDLRDDVLHERKVLPHQLLFALRLLGVDLLCTHLLRRAHFELPDLVVLRRMWCRPAAALRLIHPQDEKAGRAPWVSRAERRNIRRIPGQAEPASGGGRVHDTDDSVMGERAIVADELALARLGVISVLHAQGVDVVAETHSGRELVSVATLERPDLVVVGRPADLTVAETVQRLTRLRPRTSGRRAARAGRGSRGRVPRRVGRARRGAPGGQRRGPRRGDRLGAQGRAARGDGAAARARGAAAASVSPHRPTTSSARASGRCWPAWRRAGPTGRSPRRSR